jgi:hypothetical protein
MSTVNTTNLKNPSSGSNNIVLATDGSATIATLSSTTITGTTIQGTIKSGTAVASTSGTSIDFTSIPSWVKRITVMLSAVSTSGTGLIRFQLGTSSGVVTTGYNGVASQLGGGTASATSTSGFDSTNDGGASYNRRGQIIFSTLGSNIWVMNGCYNLGTGAFQYLFSGDVTLGATLDRVRITTTNGTDTFDAGTINILYEG